MNGHKVVADTSLIINFFNGRELAGRLVDQRQIWLSSISEIELLGFHGINDTEISLLKDFIDNCMIVELSKSIRDIAIDLRRIYKLKTPDAVIAATAKYLDMPLVTYDRDFEKVKEVSSIILEGS